MTLLITGGAGYIGGHMLIDLVENCEDFIVVDNMSNGVTWAIPEGVKLYIADTGDYQEMRRIIYEHRVDTVIHFAATLIKDLSNIIVLTVRMGVPYCKHAPTVG
jgi:UDP-glucose 4-epimerase